LLLRRPRLPIRSDVLFQKEGRQFLAQGTRQPLTLDERHQLILIALREHPLEGNTRPPKELLAQSFPILAAQIQATFHGHPPKGGETVISCPGKMVTEKLGRRNGFTPAAPLHFAGKLLYYG